MSSFNSVHHGSQTQNGTVAIGTVARFPGAIDATLINGAVVNEAAVDDVARALPPPAPRRPNLVRAAREAQLSAFQRCTGRVGLPELKRQIMEQQARLDFQAKLLAEQARVIEEQSVALQEQAGLLKDIQQTRQKRPRDHEALEVATPIGEPAGRLALSAV